MADMTRLRRLTEEAVNALRTLADEARAKGVSHVVDEVEGMANDLGPLVRGAIGEAENGG